MKLSTESPTQRRDGPSPSSDSSSRMNVLGARLLSTTLTSDGLECLFEVSVESPLGPPLSASYMIVFDDTSMPELTVRSVTLVSLST